MSRSKCPQFGRLCLVDCCMYYRYYSKSTRADVYQFGESVQPTGQDILLTDQIPAVIDITSVQDKTTGMKSNPRVKDDFERVYK